MSVHHLAITAAQLALGLLLAESLPAVACQALEDGLDSPSLRILAGLTPIEVGEARALFGRVLAELKVLPPSDRQAVLLLARQAASEILSGALTPYQGARAIWQLCGASRAEIFPELDPFIYAASEWEDRPDFRPALEVAIREQATSLLLPDSHDSAKEP